jgi:hypothetical protein
MKPSTQLTYGKVVKRIGARVITVWAVGLWACLSSAAWSQTPSPLQEWQYSSGVALEKLFEPKVPDWRVVLGVGAEYRPLYDGANLTRTQAGPVIHVSYKDIAFASVARASASICCTAITSAEASRWATTSVGSFRRTSVI